jgi:hypothetical protein
MDALSPIGLPVGLSFVPFELPIGNLGGFLAAS